MAPRLVWYSLPPLPSASPSSPATHLAPVRCWSKEDSLAILERGGEEASSVHVLFGAMVASPQGGCVEKRWRRRPGVKKTCQKSQNRKIAKKGKSIIGHKMLKCFTICHFIIFYKCYFIKI